MFLAFYNYERRIEMLYRKIRTTILLACAAVVLSASLSVYALTTQEKINLKEAEKQQTVGKLNETKENLSSLQTEQKNLKSTLQNLNDKLNEVSTNLADLESQIAQKNQDIAQTKEELEQARKTANDQYAAMKKRVQYMYERGQWDFLETLLHADSFADMLNYYEYVNALSSYDRKMLTQFESIRDEVDAKEKQLQKENEQLEAIRVDVQAEQARVSGLVSTTSNSISSYSNQISIVEAEADVYEETIKQQEKDLATLRKKLAEEIAMSRLAAQSARRDISQVSFGEGDRILLANLIYCEAGGEPYAGKLAVGAVVINRVLSSVYPDTVTGVIYQSGQFSPVKSGRFDLALATGRANAACYQAADEAMAGVSNVGNCVYFRTPVLGLNGIAIGNHIFY